MRAGLVGALCAPLKLSIAGLNASCSMGTNGWKLSPSSAGMQSSGGASVACGMPRISFTIPIGGNLPIPEVAIVMVLLRRS